MCRTYSEVLQGETCGLMLLCSYLNVICCFWMFAASLKEFWIGTRYTHINKPCKDIVQLEMGPGYERVFWNHGGIPAIELRLLRQLEPQPRWEQQRLGLIASRRKGPDATSYQERIRREEGARLVRLGPALPNSGMHEATKAKNESSEFETSNLAWCWNMLGICWIQMFGKVCWWWYHDAEILVSKDVILNHRPPQTI